MWQTERDVVQTVCIYNSKPSTNLHDKWATHYVIIQQNTPVCPSLSKKDDGNNKEGTCK